MSIELHIIDLPPERDRDRDRTTTADSSLSSSSHLQDIFVHPALYPAGTLRGDILIIRPAAYSTNSGKGKDRPLLFKVGDEAEAGTGSTGGGAPSSSGGAGAADKDQQQRRTRGKPMVTVASNVASSFPWIKNRVEVVLQLITAPEPEPELIASHVELYFNNLYLSRPDMFRLSLSLTSTILCLNQRISLPGSSATKLRVGEIYNCVGKTVRSAYIDEDTKIIFRSESARAYVFVEVSQEMWHFEEDGSMLLEKCEVFLQELFSHWTGKIQEGADAKNRGHPTSHTVSIVLYGRVIYEDNGEGEEERAPLCQHDDGTLYRDFYKVVLDLTTSPSPSIVRTVLSEIRSWQESVLLRTLANGEQKLAGRIAYAHESPVLEAANVALNSFEQHWIDRDLQRTGLEVIVLTAGTSYYHVPKELLRLTTERMLYHGVGLDLISLSKTPLHSVPLFSFRSHEPGLSEATPVVPPNVPPPPFAPSSPSRTAFSPHHRSTPSREFHTSSHQHNFSALGLVHPGSSSLLSSSPNRTSTGMANTTMSTSFSSRTSGFPSRPAGPLRTTTRERLTADALAQRPLLNHAQPHAQHPHLPPSLAAAPTVPRPSLLPSDQRDPLYYDSPSSLLQETSVYYSEPMFVFCSFFGSQVDKPHRVDRFMPRARCYELFAQGPGERMPIAIPLLPVATSSLSSSLNGGGGGEGSEASGNTGVGVGGGGGAVADQDEEGWGYLTELEKRQKRREKYDAEAVGARGGDDWVKSWGERQSGATSVGSLSGVTPGTEGSQSGEGGNALGLGFVGMRETAAGVERKRSVKRQQQKARLMASTTAAGLATDGEWERERERRGREERAEREGRNETKRGDARSKTPTARSSSQATARYPTTTRSSSIAASVRTVSSRHDGASIRGGKTSSGSSSAAATPALIARLTAAVSTPNTTAAPGAATTSTTGGTATSSRPSWLGGIFRSNTSVSTASTQQPSVAVQKVEVQANLAPEFDLEGDSSVSNGGGNGSSTSNSNSTPTAGSSTNPYPPNTSSRSSARAQSPSGSSSRRSLSIVNSRPTQPISIATRAAQTRDADRPTAAGNKTGGGLRSSPAARGYPGMGGGSGKGGITGGTGGGATGGKSAPLRFNPSKPGKQSVGLADQTRRWASIFIRHTNDQRAVNWVSITRGACLPLTTDYLPTADDLTSHYSNTSYDVRVDRLPESFLLRIDNPRRSAVLELVTELISQRLSHGFQIVTPANHIGALDEINHATSKSIPDVLRDIHSGELTAVYLTLAHQIHRIWYDRRRNVVSIKISRRNQSWKVGPYAYRPLIFPQGASVYTSSPLEFPYPDLIGPSDWEHLDLVVAGAAQPDLRPSLRYWRTRLVLLPAQEVPDREFLVSRHPAFGGAGQDAPTDEEIHDQGFFAFMELIEAAKWVPPGKQKEQRAIEHTSLTAPEWALRQSRHPPPPPSQTTVATLEPPVNPPKSSAWPFKKLLDTTPALPIVPLPEVSTPSNTGSHSNSVSTSHSLSHASSISPSIPSSPSSSAAPLLAPPAVEMAYTTTLDLDTKHLSLRSEKVLCHLDLSHNVRAAYHCELNWLAGSGRVIDQAIGQWSNRAKRFGLKLIEVSTRTVEDRHNPFQVPRVVETKKLPPVVERVEEKSKGVDEEEEEEDEEDEDPMPEHYFEAALLTHLSFYLDILSDSSFPPSLVFSYAYRPHSIPHSQYIHQSGTLLVAVVGPGQFATIPNRIYTSHNPTIDKDQALRSLEEICGDEEKLEELWKRFGEEWEQGREERRKRKKMIE